MNFLKKTIAEPKGEYVKKSRIRGRTTSTYENLRRSGMRREKALSGKLRLSLIKFYSPENLLQQRRPPSKFTHKGDLDRQREIN